MLTPQMVDRLWTAFFDTLFMVGVSTAIAVVVGIPLAVFLVTSGKDGIFPSPKANKVIGTLVNAVRAVPFIVLMVAIIPLTRILTGTTIGVWAAIVPLSLAAIPFFARIVEVSLREVDHGLIEAAQSIGCRRGQIIRHVLLPEALAGIIGALTITVVTLIGSSAMAGVVGAGGLGNVAMAYGYQRFDTTVMLVVVAILILLVSAIQLTGDLTVRYLKSR